MKISRFIAASTFFVSLTCLIYWVHISFFRVNVVFYSAMLDGILAATITGTIVWRFNTFNSFGAFEKFLLTPTSQLLGNPDISNSL